MKCILASGSQRRKELLEQIGIEFEVIKSSIEEVITEKEPDKVVIQLSKQKAQDIYDKISNQNNSKNDKALQKSGNADILVIGADTIVYNQDQILGKPKDAEDAFRIIKALQGRSHYVYTGVTLINSRNIISFAEKTRVDVYPMSDDEIKAYISTDESMDKAGAYGIQGTFAAYISGISGDYNNVVGLPVGRLYQTIKTLIKSNK